MSEEYTVTEWCPHRESEIEITWNVGDRGYKEFCPVCGKRLMLCDECQHADDALPCDYDRGTDSCRFNQKRKRKSVMKLVAKIEVNIRKEDMDSILCSAFNAGGISLWADKIWASGRKLGERVCEQIGLGGKVLIHDRIGGETYSLTPEKFEKGVRLYLEEGCHVRVEDGHLVPEDVTMIDADCIVQFALFEEVRYS